MQKIIYCMFGFIFLFCLNGNILGQGVDPGTTNLKHLWTFEDGTPNDGVGTANGEFHGDNISVDQGDLLNVPNLDNNIADSWLELPGDQIDIGGYNEVSVVAWFTPDGANNTNWNSVWFFGDDGAGAGTGSDGICLQARRGDGHARFWFTAGAPAGYNAEDGVNDIDYGNYNNDELYFVVCEVTPDDSIKMYHDAQLIGTTALTTNPATGVTKNIADISPNFARFCHAGYSADVPWVGRIHEIAIYNRVLSADEITFLYNKGFTVTGINDEATNIPAKYSLLQNYPNPFNPTTTIEFSLAKPGFASLTVYDMLGQPVATLVNGELKSGYHNVNFDASNLSSGIYLYSLKTSDFSDTKKFILLK